MTRCCGHHIKTGQLLGACLRCARLTLHAVPQFATPVRGNSPMNGYPCEGFVANEIRIKGE